MKKILIYTLLIFISLILPNKTHAISTIEANELIDINKASSLTLNYYYDDYNFDNTNVKIYYIASVTPDYIYKLSSDFSDYPIKINGITSEKDWEILKQTLNSYIEADSINEIKQDSIKDNTITITNLIPGLYFIKTEKIDTENYTLLFDSFLISVPNLQEDGTWNYNVTVYPKAEEYIPKFEKITYTVIKQWQDNQKNRPQNIEIEIYEDGKLTDSQILSSNNNWIYNWTTDDDGSTWTVVERNIPDGYTVSISKEDLNFIIINTDPDYQEDNPSTHDNIKLTFYLVFISLLGVTLSIIGLKLQKKNRK